MSPDRWGERTETAAGGPPAAEGAAMHALATELFPITRSLTGEGVRATLAALGRVAPITVHEVPSGTPVGDWTVPPEWRIGEAYVIDPDGRRIIDIADNNLHVVGYSTPVDDELSLEDLQGHLYSLPDQPDAIPYVTSYYARRWGFCMAHADRERLRPGTYRVRIDSELFDGSLSYGELVIPGASAQEVFVSTYVCHPSMANNELSGPVVAAFLARWIAAAPRRYTYRLVFAPETIGAITYLSRNLAHLRRNVVAGFVVTCIGDDRDHSFLPSRRGGTLADRVALHVLGSRHPGFSRYTYLDRGSDERQYCSPGVNLPMVSVMRSKYREYPEYHTSLDDLDLVTASGLQGGLDVVRECIRVIEANRRYRLTTVGEPQLGRRGLYPDLSMKGSAQAARTLVNLLAHADGDHDLVEIAEIIGVPAIDLIPHVERLLAEDLLETVPG